MVMLGSRVAYDSAQSKRFGPYKHMDNSPTTLITPYPGVWKAVTGSSLHVIEYPKQLCQGLEEEKNRFLDAASFAIVPEDARQRKDAPGVPADERRLLRFRNQGLAHFAPLPCTLRRSLLAPPVTCFLPL